MLQSTVFKTYQIFSTQKDILISPSCPNGVPSCSEKRFSWSFRNQLRLKDGSPDCRNNSWNTTWETDEYKQTQPLSITAALNHSLVFVVHLLFWQWGFRVLFQVISDPVERVHLLSPAGRHGVLIAIGKKQGKRKTWNRDGVAPESCVYVCWSCIIYHVTYYFKILFPLI